VRGHLRLTLVCENFGTTVRGSWLPEMAGSRWRAHAPLIDCIGDSGSRVLRRRCSVGARYALERYRGRVSIDKGRPWPPKSWASGGNSYRAEGSGKDEIRRHCLGLPIACRQVARRALFSRSSLATLGRWRGGKNNLAPDERLGPNQAARKFTAWMDTRKEPCLEGPQGKRSVDPRDAPRPFVALQRH